jgi:CubicO group peptidase (beta-lactamase class C family)
MKLLKFLLTFLLLGGLWSATALYGAISGWWLTPLAEQGDSEAFMDAAIRMGNDQSRGNLALVLMRNGVVFREHYQPSIDPVDRQTLFPLASMSKWITAYGVMQLVESNKVDLDMPVSRYLTRWNLPVGEHDNDGVTIRRLLSHTAGLTDELGFGDYAPDEQVPSLVDTLRQPRASSGAAVISVGIEPGSEWHYSGGGYLILQLIIEEASGMAFASWMQQAVFDPLQMTRATYAYLGNQPNASRSFDAVGKPAPVFRYAAAAATGLSASAADLIRFAQAQIRGHGPIAQSLSPDNVEQMREPSGQTLGINIWGLGTMLYAPTAGADYVFGHDGSNDPAINSALRINPDNGDAIIVLVSGHPELATSIAFEWTLWQTGAPDFLMLNRLKSSVLVPWISGLFILALTICAYSMWRQRTNLARTSISDA